ncbi:MAG: hydrolase [Aestuariivirga sp.]
MQTNAVPAVDMSVNTTGCCPKFNPEGWDNQELHFENKRFLRAKTTSVAHIPINMGSVFARVQEHIDEAKAMDPNDYIVLSRETSAFGAEHLFAVTKPIPDEDMTTLSGNFVTKVFEGPYREMRHWYDEMIKLAEAKGSSGKPVWFFYTTCPKCAKAYGANYVVGVAEI